MYEDLLVTKVIKAIISFVFGIVLFIYWIFFPDYIIFKILFSYFNLNYKKNYIQIFLKKKSRIFIFGRKFLKKFFILKKILTFFNFNFFYFKN